ncbi:hypothetical protein O3P69_016830 [Scylla paramamosain]|uniref:Uncharacterized protein n=1 Tax=Scylla paramamosain TaxID=85552 RepID=A0AAW0T0G5_SCYPA
MEHDNRWGVKGPPTTTTTTASVATTAAAATATSRKWKKLAGNTPHVQAAKQIDGAIAAAGKSTEEDAERQLRLFDLCSPLIRSSVSHCTLTFPQFTLPGFREQLRKSVSCGDVNLHSLPLVSLRQGTGRESVIHQVV